MTYVHPRTLREALAFLARRPLVRFTTRLGTRVLRSRLRFVRIRNGVIWFEPHVDDGGGEEATATHPSPTKGEGVTGLPLHGTSEEVGLVFDEAGFDYHRGTAWVRVAYGHDTKGS
jgi:hypothetical protein